VDAGRGLDDRFVGWRRESEEFVGEGAGGVDDAFGADVPGVAGEVVFEPCTVEFAGGVFVELGYFAVVGGDGAVFDGTHD